MRALALRRFVATLLVAVAAAFAPERAAADYWEATAPNVPPQQFPDGVSGAIWAICTTYGCGCNGTGPACTIERCYPVMDINGYLSLYKCDGISVTVHKTRIRRHQ